VILQDVDITLPSVAACLRMCLMQSQLKHLLIYIVVNRMYTSLQQDCVMDFWMFIYRSILI